MIRFWKRRGNGKNAETEAAVARARNYFLDIEGPRRRRRRRITVILFAAAAAALFGGAFWIVFASPLFAVREIRVEGVSALSADAVRGAAREIVGAAPRIGSMVGAENMLAWGREAEEPLRKILPRAKTVVIERSFSARAITIRVAEREPRAVVCSAQANSPQEENAPHSCFWMDDDGILFDRAPLVEGNLVFVLTDYSDTGLSLGGAAFPARFAGNLLSIFGVLRTAGVSVAEARVEDRGLEEVTVKLNGGPDLYFSLRFPADHALAVIESFGNGKAARFPELEYIDFRVEGRAYYK